MKIFFAISFLLTILLNDFTPNKISWNPYYPNHGVTKEQLMEEGFILSILEQGGCSYEKTKNKKKYLVFYADSTEECQNIKYQEIYISLSDSIAIDAVINPNRKITKKDSIGIESILKNYESKKISSFKKIDPCISTFRAENKQGKILEWNVFMCNTDLILNVSADLSQ